MKASPGKEYATQREAVAAAKKNMRVAGSGQFVVHGDDGDVLERGTYKMPRLPDLPKTSSRAKEIGRAVALVVLERVKADSSGERPSKN